MRMVVGSIKESNEVYRDFLQGFDIIPNYVQTACGHNMYCMISAEGENNYTFIAKHIGKKNNYLEKTLENK
jgi:hypothetical protein